MKLMDMHCDTISRLLELEEAGKPEELRENSGHLDLEKMKKGGYRSQNFALFVELRRPEDALLTAMKLADLFYRELERNEDTLRLARNVREMEENERAGKMSAFLTIEEGGVCKGSLAALRDFYLLGVRMMTLTWNYENELGFPNTMNEMPGTGLKPAGFAFVEEMERLGMIIDVSHLSDQGFYDVYRCTKKPFVASHSNARALCPHSRNLTDDMLRLLGERGGVAGINFATNFLDPAAVRGKSISRIQDMIAHMKHIANTAGIESVGLGTDYDGIGGSVEIADASGMQRLVSGMEQAGFTASEIEKICWRNVERVYREVLH